MFHFHSATAARNKAIQGDDLEFPCLALALFLKHAEECGLVCLKAWVKQYLDALRIFEAEWRKRRASKIVQGESVPDISVEEAWANLSSTERARFEKLATRGGPEHFDGALDTESDNVVRFLFPIPPGPTEVPEAKGVVSGRRSPKVTVPRVRLSMPAKEHASSSVRREETISWGPTACSRAGWRSTRCFGTSQSHHYAN